MDKHETGSTDMKGLNQEETHVNQQETVYVSSEKDLLEGDVILAYRVADTGYIGYDTNGYEMNEFNGPHSYIIVKRNAR